MNHWIRQPVTCNVITIAALAAFVFATAFAGGELDNSLARAEITLEQLAAETEVVDEAMLASAKESVVERNQAAGSIYLMVFVAIVSSFAANYIGRGRQFDNSARIRELEAYLAGKS